MGDEKENIRLTYVFLQYIIYDIYNSYNNSYNALAKWSLTIDQFLNINILKLNLSSLSIIFSADLQQFKSIMMWNLLIITVIKNMGSALQL